jgi:glucose/arabinose dehydrogenase
MHFGVPYCQGGDVLDPEFGAGHACADYTPPAQKLGPHVASLGMRFYDGEMFPAEYRNQIFVAEHGSWNRSSKIGYRVSLVRLEGDRAVSYEPFVSGWLRGPEAWGRPVDVQVAADGALLVSDDRAGAIYRVSYASE